MATPTGSGEGGAGDAPDREVSSPSLDDLSRRIDAAKERLPKETAEPADNALGMAFRIGTEMVAGLAVGGFIGWQIDRFAGPRPLFFLVFIGLGGAAGILNVFRYADRMHAAAKLKAEGGRRPGAAGKGAGRSAPDE